MVIAEENKEKTKLVQLVKSSPTTFNLKHHSHSISVKGLNPGIISKVG